MDAERLITCQGYSDLRQVLKATFLFPGAFRKALSRVILKAHLSNSCGSGRFLPRLRQLLQEEGLSEDVCQLRLQEYTQDQSRQLLRRVYEAGVPW